MIEPGGSFGFVPKSHKRLVRIHLMSEDAFHGDDPAGVPLPSAINHSHAAASNFCQDLVMTQVPFVVGHFGFCKDALERFT
jgi:hypothetical protein